MKKRVSRVLVAGALLASAGWSAGQAVPSLINYQGFVTDASGTPLGMPATNYEIAFALYDSATGGTLLWAEKQVITVVDGQFSTLLGQGAQVDIVGDATDEPKPALEDVFDGPLRFLSLRVLVPPATELKNAPEIAPRQQIVSSPFAVRAQIANTVEADAVGAAQIADGAVGASEIAGNAIDASKIADGTLLPADFLANSLTAAQIGTGAVGSDEIADGSIVMADLAADAGITGGQIADGTIGTVDIATGAITGTLIANGTITSTDLSANAGITGSQIAANAITGTLIANGTITSSDISNAANITGAQIANGTLTASDLNGTVGVFDRDAGTGLLTYTAPTSTVDLKSTVITGTSAKVKLSQSNGTGVEMFYDGDNDYFKIGPVQSGTPASGNHGISVSNKGASVGWVGIRKTNPSYSLDVEGSIRASNGLIVEGLGFFSDRNVQVRSSGLFGYDNSSRKYKRNVEELEVDADAFLKVAPKRYTRPDRPDYWEIGYIAEEIDELGLKDLVLYDEEGAPDALRYDRFSMFLTEVVKGHRVTIRELESENGALKDRLERLEALVGKLAGETLE